MAQTTVRPVKLTPRELDLLDGVFMLKSAAGADTREGILSYHAELSTNVLDVHVGIFTPSSRMRTVSGLPASGPWIPASPAEGSPWTWRPRFA